ncbi:MAG: hypothetical protein HUK22_02370, partial [Thermoguttaceae bacterium]|nr:hypothetical protein [Thermoguttaceae bacterium]
MFLKHKASLLRMIAKKLTSKMGARICPEDVLSESMEAALKQLRNGTSAPKVSELIWLRLIVNQQIQP